jgi:hypothetical protein
MSRTSLFTDQDWVAQISINFKSQLNPKCKLILCTFKEHLTVNYVLLDT